LDRSRTSLLDNGRPAGPRGGRPRQRNVLLVDDDTDIRETLATVLEGQGYKVRCAENGAQALEMMQGRKPGVVVLDLMMPVMSGWQFLDVVRGDAELSRVPIVVLSAGTPPAGVRYLAKPVSLEDLVQTLDRVCGR
jgi:CheY-like chemotaxis protein